MHIISSLVCSTIPQAARYGKPPVRVVFSGSSRTKNKRGYPGCDIFFREAAKMQAQAKPNEEQGQVKPLPDRKI